MPASHMLSQSLHKDRETNYLIHFPGQPLEEEQSLELLGLTICHNLLWEEHIVANSHPPGVRSAAPPEWRPSRSPDGQFSRDPSGTIARNQSRAGI